MLRKIIKGYTQLIQWHTPSKIIVIESDDWGCVRMPDKETRVALAKLNPNRIADTISEIDSLETNDDLTALFDVLSSVKDKNGNHAVLTANTIVANPDFEKIAQNNYSKYEYEPFTETLKRYPNRDKVESLIKEGIKGGYYIPQFHGREHLNVRQWMTALQNGHPELVEAFKYNVFGIPLIKKISKRKNVMAALDMEHSHELEEQQKIIGEGVELFAELFGFHSKSFIATTYVWSKEIESVLHKNGIKYLQGIPFQFLPTPNGKKFKRKFHYTGQRNKHGQVYLVRNVFFEPSIIKTHDIVAECLSRIEKAFQNNIPVIMGSHRVNFIGSIEEDNRTINLILFKALLKKIVSKWPDVVFMSTDQLGELITNN